MHDMEMRKKAVDGLSRFLDDRLSARMLPKPLHNTEPDFEPHKAPKGESVVKGHDSFHSHGDHTGNAHPHHNDKVHVAHGEGNPAADMPDSDPGKERAELEHSDGLTDDERDDLAEVYDKE